MKQDRNRRCAPLTLLGLTALFVVSSQNLISPNLTDVATEFGFSDEKRDLLLGGQLPLTFFVAGGLAAIFIGPLADEYSRKNLFCFAALVQSVPCFLVYWTTTFYELYIVYVFTGMGTGMAIPVLYSLVSDSFPIEERNFANGILSVVIGLGLGLGQIVAGFLGPSYGWRLPFLVLSSPIFLSVGMICILVKEPERGRYAPDVQIPSNKESCEVPFWTKYMLALSTPTNGLVLVQSIVGCIPFGVSATFMIDYLHENKGLSVQGGTFIFLVYGVGFAIGNIGGGALGQWLQNNKGGPSVGCFVGLCTILGTMPWYYILNGKLNNSHFPQDPNTLSLLVCPLCGCLGGVAGPNLRAVLMNLNPPRQQATMFSLFTVTDDMGKGLGPVFISLLLIKFGRENVFNMAYSCWIFSGVLQSFVTLTYEEDERVLRLMNEQIDSSASDRSMTDQSFTQQVT